MDNVDFTICSVMTMSRSAYGNPPTEHDLYIKLFLTSSGGWIRCPD